VDVAWTRAKSGCAAHACHNGVRPAKFSPRFDICSAPYLRLPHGADCGFADWDRKNMPRGKLAKRLVLAVAALLAVPALFAGYVFAQLVILDPFGGTPHPTDEAMLARFQAKRPILEELVRRIEQRPELQRVGPDFTRPEDVASAGVSADTIAGLRRLCTQAGVAHGFSYYGDSIELIVHTRGLAISGSAKGFVHAAEPDRDATIVEGDLDAAAASPQHKDGLLERRIDGNWWLELDRR
jgi:hypothetical protein